MDRRRSLEVADLTDAWTETEQEDAQTQMAETAMRLYEDIGGHAVNQDDLDRIANASALGAFQIALIRSQPVRLILDGHNVLHQLRSSWGADFEGGQPSGKARSRLVESVRRLCVQGDTLSVDIWFDGPVAEQYTLSSQLKVQFSGGHGSDRADGCIEASLRHFHMRRFQGLIESADEVVFVVSADRDVCASARALGAVVTSPIEFSRLIG
jgi:hypothetical protein